MKSCCADVIIEMQKDIQLGNWLKLLLAASPFILMIPNLDPTMNIEGARDFIVEEIVKASVEQVKTRLGKQVSLPGFTDACLAADCFSVNLLAQRASHHAITHSVTSQEYQIWMKLAMSYSNAVASGQCAQPVSGWLPWNW